MCIVHALRKTYLLNKVSFIGPMFETFTFMD